MIPPGDQIPPYLALYDLTMLALLGSKERTANEYRALLEAAGFAEVAIFPTGTDWSVVEAIRP